MKKRALISVYDKQGVLELAEFLKNNNVEIISTGGTYNYLKQNGIDVIEVSEVTGFEEILDGRVKTLNPIIHSGILAIRDNKNHMETINKKNINTIDYVIVNLYPFFEKVSENLSFEETIEFIDIGGPTMLRAAAKNFQDVVVCCNYNEYQNIIDETKNNGEVSYNTKKRLAGKVFNLMGAYDSAIANFMLKDIEEYPEYLSVSLRKKQDLRYGENSHQTAAFYESTTVNGSMNSFEFLNGKKLSYNNYKDVDIAWKCVTEFEKPACSAIKHNTPCGVAIGTSVNDAYNKTYNVDSTSIFGGIVSFNKKLDVKTAKQMSEIFLEVILAPDYDKEALEILQKKKNLIVLKFKNLPQDDKYMVTVDGGILVQQEDKKLYNELNVVTDKNPTEKEMEDLVFAMKCVKYVKSNAIVVANDGVALGIGGGQVNRLWPTQDALKRGVGATVLASDAFFPFRDIIDTVSEYGIKAIIQPGGSIRDEDSIKACNEHEISMVMTGIRHFKH